jgi:hypothetical protein
MIMPCCMALIMKSIVIGLYEWLMSAKLKFAYKLEAFCLTATR